METQKLLLSLAAICACSLIGNILIAQPSPADAASTFGGEKTAWHGFDRYDFQMDSETLAISPIKAADDEKDGIQHTIAGQRRCVVVIPKAAAPGNPWSWRGCYWDHQPQTEIGLLKHGFSVAYVESSAALRPGKEWDAWYAFLTEKHGFSRKPAFVGMSRGGEFSFTWATANPDKVSAIYADNPGSNPGVFRNLGDLAMNDVPLLLVCGSIDPLLERNAQAIQNIYQQFGGQVSIMIKEGRGHHPHSLRQPKPIVDFLVQSVQPRTHVAPDFAGDKFARSYYYSTEKYYRNFPAEDTFITCSGPQFSASYDRYAFEIRGVEGVITVIVPTVEAPDKPWVYRAGFVSRDATVDQALLTKGFHIVAGPISYNADGPIQAHWDAVYNYLTAHGFSKKPVMEGAGQAAGEVYAWAIANPEKVSCIYGENPVLRSNLAKIQPLDNLAPLARAGVPILHLCGSLDPRLNDQTRIAEQRYKDLGGKITVIIAQGQGHYPLSPTNPEKVIDFITKNIK